MLSFYRIPKLLFTNDFFKALSTDAKVLYGLMLDRMSLSIKNKWIDEGGRAYIYLTVEDTMEMLNCKKNKAIDTIKELEAESGLGLIEKKRQGQGKPTIIYVKNFMLEGAEIIRENLDWEILCDRYPYDRELLEGIYDIILETVLCKSESVLIARNEYPVQLVKSKFLKLHSGNIEYVVDCLKGNTSKVRNIKKYLLAALFNAPTTISGYYQAEVNHDMPQLVRNKYY